MVSQPGQKNFINESDDRERSARAQKAQTGVNFHQPMGNTDTNQYLGNDAGLGADGATDKHLPGSQQPLNINALHRSQSYKLKLRQQTAGMTQKVNQDAPLDFESMHNVSGHLLAETQQSLIDYAEMAHVVDQSHHITSDI